MVVSLESLPADVLADVLARVGQGWLFALSLVCKGMRDAIATTQDPNEPPGFRTTYASALASESAIDWAVDAGASVDMLGRAASLSVPLCVDTLAHLHLLGASFHTQITCLIESRSSPLGEALALLGKPSNALFRVRPVSQDSWSVSWSDPALYATISTPANGIASTAFTRTVALIEFANADGERDALSVGAVACGDKTNWFSIDRALGYNKGNTKVIITCRRHHTMVSLVQKQKLGRELLKNARGF